MRLILLALLSLLLMLPLQVGADTGLRVTKKAPLPPERTSTEATQALAFVREQIYLEVFPGELRVFGRYWIKNRTAGPVEARIRYPIIVTETILQPRDLVVPGYRVFLGDAGPLWTMKFEQENEVQLFELSYRQRLTGNEAAYMVTSANKWDTAIEKAEFFVSFPKHWSNVNTSYQMQEVKSTGQRRKLYMIKEPFTPDREVWIRWGE